MRSLVMTQPNSEGGPPVGAPEQPGLPICLFCARFLFSPVPVSDQAPRVLRSSLKPRAGMPERPASRIAQPVGVWISQTLLR